MIADAAGKGADIINGLKAHSAPQSRRSDGSIPQNMFQPCGWSRQFSRLSTKLSKVSACRDLIGATSQYATDEQTADQCTGIRPVLYPLAIKIDA